MNAQLEAQISSILSNVQDTAHASSSFILERAPILCKQIVAWELWSNAGQGIFNLLLLIISSIICYKTRKAWKNDDFTFNVFLNMICIIMIMVTLCFSIEGFYGMIKPLVAPDLIILDYIKAIIK